MTNSTPANAASDTIAPSEVLAPAPNGMQEAPAVNTSSDEKGAAAAEESTVATDPEDASPESGEDDTKASRGAGAPAPIVSQSKRSRPTYKYDPEKITLRFLFANKDGLTVTVECKPADTVSEVKGALLSVWPEDLPSCSGGDRLRLICMGKGMLMPDTRTLEDCQVPVFKTHPTPINVSVRPETVEVGSSKGGGESKGGRGSSSGGGPSAARTPPSGTVATDQGCACIIL